MTTLLYRWALLLTGVLLTFGCTDGAVPFSDDFEGRALRAEQWDVDSEGGCTITPVAAPGVDSNRALRFSAEEGARCEVVPKVFSGFLGKYRHEPFRTERWYVFSMYIEEPWQPNDRNEVLAQWHADPDEILGDEKFRGPPLALRIYGDRFRITYGWDANFISNTGWRANHALWSDPVVTGRWLHWKFQARWSHREDGLLRIWLNDELIVDHSGPNAYNDLRGVYLKLGIYHPGSSRRLLLDDVHIGDSPPPDQPGADGS